MNVFTSKFSVTSLGTAIVLGTIVFISGCGKSEPVDPEPVVRPVKLYTIESDGLKRLYEYPGQVQPKLQANLAFEVPGRLVSLTVDEGEKVQKGAVLASLDPRDYESKLNSSIAVLKEAESQQKRDQALFDKDAGSKEELERSIRAVETAQANVEIARKAFEDTNLKAPFAGTVAKVLVDEFENVGSKQTVLVLEETSNMEAVINIPENIWIQAKKGSTLQEISERTHPQIIMTSMPDRAFPAQIKATATKANAATRTFAITFAFTPPEDLNVSSGMTAKARFTSSRPLTSKSGGIAVPVASVGFDAEGKAFVWRIDPDTMRASKVVVEAGEMAEDMMEVFGPLQKGEILATSGIHHLREGMQVKAWTN
jgi:RND family efflux transporter MFP subunit